MSDYIKNVDYPMDDDTRWLLLQDNYERFFLNNEDTTQCIPKKIHQVWVGSPVPDKYKRLTDTWRNLHLDWEYKLWTDDDVEPFGMKSKALYDLVENKGSKADIFRYEIMCRHGGIYADTDFECIKPFDDFLHLDFFGGSGWTHHPCTFNGLFGAPEKHHLFYTVIKTLNEKIIQPHNRLDEINHITGADFFSNIVMDYLSRTTDKSVIFPKNFFYPFPPELRFGIKNDTEKDRQLTYSYIKPRTYAIHLWYTSWQN